MSVSPHSLELNEMEVKSNYSQYKIVFGVIRRCECFCLSLLSGRDFMPASIGRTWKLFWDLTEFLVKIDENEEINKNLLANSLEWVHWLFVVLIHWTVSSSIIEIYKNVVSFKIY